jgi:hypothetical protein
MTLLAIEKTLGLQLVLVVARAVGKCDLESFL